VFAFSDGPREQYKVGLVGQPTAQLEGFLASRYVQFIDYAAVADGVPKVERHQLDLLLDTSTNAYWVNEEAPGGYFMERLLLGGAADAAGFDRRAVTGDAVRYVDWVLPGVLGMNMMFSALWGIGYVIVRYRKNGVLKRLRATPVTSLEFLLAQLISRLWLLVSIGALIYLGCDLFVGFQMHGSYFDLLLVFALGCFSLISLGLMVASRTSSEELANGLLNMMSMPMMFLSGVWFSLEGAAPWMRWLAEFFPLTHLTRATRAIMLDGAGLADVSLELGVLAATSAVFLALGAKAFRWE
jgi:ABC-type multidrug transport system permease subunit